MQRMLDNNSRETIVPEVLLALVKDSRYIELCQSLLTDVLSPFSSNLKHPDTTLCAASILYATTVVLRTGRSLGMEACGLSFQQKKWHSWSALVMTALWVHALKRWSSNINNTSSRMASVEDDNSSVINENNNGDTSSPFPIGLNHLGSQEESLRGDARRRFHQEQQQAMRLRASQLEGDADQSGNNSTQQQRTTTSNNTTPNTAETSLLSVARWKKRVFESLRSLVVPRGPHVISDPNFNDDTLLSQDGQNQQQRSDGSLTLAVTWALRLHLALFAMGGKYPTWLHRVWGLSITQQERGRLAERPSTIRSVGMVIVLQGVATLFQKVTIRTIDFWMKKQQYRRRGWRLSSVRQMREQTPRVQHALQENTEDESPVIPTPSITCGICRGKRSYPAAPVSCGHVFCWKCVYHWVSTVRPECPLCRSACRPQDLIALHQYAPHEQENTLS